MLTPIFNLDFYIFPIMNNSKKFKEISSTSFYCIIAPQYIFKENCSENFIAFSPSTPARNLAKDKRNVLVEIEMADINKAVSDSLKEIIINAINEIRSIKKRPDNKAIFSFVITNSATNYKQEFIDSALNYMDRHNMITNRPNQGRSQNLKEVPQNLTEVFNIDDVTANDVIQRNQHRKGKQINLSYIVITDVKLAS